MVQTIQASAIPQIGFADIKTRVSELLGIANMAIAEKFDNGFGQVNKTVKVDPAAKAVDAKATNAAEAVLQDAGYEVHISTHYYGKNCYCSFFLKKEKKHKFRLFHKG